MITYTNANTLSVGSGSVSNGVNLPPFFSTNTELNSANWLFMLALKRTIKVGGYGSSHFVNPNLGRGSLHHVYPKS